MAERQDGEAFHDGPDQQDDAAPGREHHMRQPLQQRAVERSHHAAVGVDQLADGRPHLGVDDLARALHRPEDGAEEEADGDADARLAQQDGGAGEGADVARRPVRLERKGNATEGDDQRVADEAGDGFAGEQRHHQEGRPEPGRGHRHQQQLVEPCRNTLHQPRTMAGKPEKIASP